MMCSGAPLSNVEVDLLVVPWCEEEGPAAVAGLDAATGGEIGAGAGRKEFRACSYEMFPAAVTDGAWRPRRVLVVGAGKRAAFGGDAARKVATAAGLWAKQRRIPRVGFVMREIPRGDAAEMAQAIAEGLTLAEFDGGSYKTGDYEAPAAPSWTVVVAGGEEAASFVRSAVARGQVLGRLQQSLTRARERTGQYADAARVRPPGDGDCDRAWGSRSMCSTKNESRSSEWDCCSAWHAAASSRRA